MRLIDVAGRERLFEVSMGSCHLPRWLCGLKDITLREFCVLSFAQVLLK
jgi:hypothetical protein